MGLKKFLQQQGFIEETQDDKKKEAAATTAAPQTASAAPAYFPVYSDAAKPSGAAISDPSFVTPLQQTTITKDQTGAAPALDASFVKFFEDELVKANLPGPDYFEFRQLLVKTQQKMAEKGGANPEVVLQAVLMSFEAQEIPPTKLIDAAKHYKDVLKKKNDDFISGAATEKNNQLQKRQTVLQSHDDNIKKIEQQMLQLDLQRKQLEESLSKEKTQMDVDKSLGKEGIEKIERATQLITVAHAYMQSAIDNDIKRLQSV